jgi:hypothetical protein
MCIYQLRESLLMKHRYLLLSLVPRSPTRCASHTGASPFWQLETMFTVIPGKTFGNLKLLRYLCSTSGTSSLIASVLERRFPASAGYGTIFPRPKHGGSPDTGMVKAFAKYYADTVLFPLAPSLLPWEKFPPSFVEDRSSVNNNSVMPCPAQN